jgi:diguanylate cyclase (GGDEF)-like protein
MANQDETQANRRADSDKTQIMIVDDEEKILNLMQHSLQDNGHNVAIFSDAKNAIEEIKKKAYDLVITDLKMPKLSGIEFVKKAKKISPKTDLVVMTGYPSVETAVECMKLGASDYIVKPLDLEYLNIIVEKSLYKKALEKRAAEREYFEHISRVDGLTGLYNHKFFHELLNAEIARSDRYKYNFSLLMIDIDNFKTINDNYGHQAGDTILKELALMFKSFVRKTDPVVRYGGEEFAIILSLTAKEQARQFADRIVNGVATSKVKGIPPSETLTISAGLAGYPDDASAQETLIKRADEALYKAKSMGKNTFCVCEDQKTT